jgi:hypothetical protein
VIHLRQVVVDRLRDGDDAQILPARLGSLRQPQRRLGGVVATDRCEDGDTKFLETVERALDLIVGLPMAARPERRRRRPPQALETIASDFREIGELASENPLDAMSRPEDLPDLI